MDIIQLHCVLLKFLLSFTVLVSTRSSFSSSGFYFEIRRARARARRSLSGARFGVCAEGSGSAPVFPKPVGLPSGLPPCFTLPERDEGKVGV